jgi:hypothetical protein
MLASFGPQVEDLKASIPPRYQFEIIAGMEPDRVGKERSSSIPRASLELA